MGRLVSRRRDWCFPGWPGGRFWRKRGFPGNAETVLGDVSAPQTAVRAIWGAYGFFYGRGGLKSPTWIKPEIKPWVDCPETSFIELMASILAQ